ncbi:hypothetical protein TWF730_007934 [Orbilia blumenaviensis]|uniref:Clr5 domain-containing protein n=1 Tax=Orbilia blumenaviensis TaxID=1796055 RepID=A0AAV9VBQ6_9PEZI
MWIPPQSTPKKQLEVNQYAGDKSSRKRAYVKIEEWEPHKEFVLRQRHAKVKEKDILYALRHERGFMVEMHQLKKVLQLWNSKRNLKRKQRDYIVQIVKERRRAGKNQTIFYHPNGTLIDHPEVKEIMRRYGNSEPREPPSPGGLVPGSPRHRQTPPDILFNNREIPTIYSDPYSFSHSNDTTSPISLGSNHSPMGEAGLEYTNATPPHLAIDVFLQQTAAQPNAGITVPTTSGYSSNISTGAGMLYQSLGFGDEILMSSAYPSQPVTAPEIDLTLDYISTAPALSAMPSSSIPSGHFPVPTNPAFFARPPAPVPVQPIQDLLINESYDYPPPAPVPVPIHVPVPAPIPPLPKRQSPGTFASPAPPQSRRPPAAAAPPPPPPPRSRSLLSRLGFPSSKKSSQPSVAVGGSMVQPSVPHPSAPYMQPSSSADQYFIPPPQAVPGPPPITPSNFAADLPAPSPILLDARYPWGEGESQPALKTSAPSRPASRRPPAGAAIKEEFPEISILDYSRDESRKSKKSRKAEDKKNSVYMELANRAGRLLSGIPPKVDESSKRARRRAGENEMRKTEGEEVMRERTEEMQTEQQHFKYNLAQEQERTRAHEQRRAQEKEEENSRYTAFEKNHPQPEWMEVEEEENWVEEETIDNWKRGPGRTWKQEPDDDDAWEEEEVDSWAVPEPSQQLLDPEQERLKETLHRVSQKPIKLAPPIMRVQREIKIEYQPRILARVEPTSKKPIVASDSNDTFKINLNDIKNEDEDDLISALGGLRVSDGNKNSNSKDSTNLLKEPKVFDNKKINEKWDDENENEEEDRWSDEEEKLDGEWEVEEKKEQKFGDGEVNNALLKLDSLTLSETSRAVTHQITTTAEPTTARHSENHIPFKRLLTLEFQFDKFQVEFASEDMELIYRTQLRAWLKEKVKTAEWELKTPLSEPNKGNERTFCEEKDRRKLPIHIHKATEHLVKASMDPDASEAEVIYETKLWNWVLRRHKNIISYMKKTSSAHWTTTWGVNEQAIVYFLPFLGKRFGSKHWFTLEAIKLLGESYLWEEIEDGWKDGLQLRNVAYDGFVNLGIKNAGILSDCVDDGIIERPERKGRRKMELRRAVEHYRTIRNGFGDWSQLGVYAIASLLRALAKVDRQRAKKLIPIAATGYLKIPRGLWGKSEVANSIWMVGEAMREVGMAKEATMFLWKAMPAMKGIEDTVESLAAARILGGIADGFDTLMKPVKAIQWRGRVLEVVSKTLGRDHPETIFWTNKMKKGLEARGYQFYNVPTLRTVEIIAGTVFLRGQKRGLNQRGLLRIARRVIRKLESGAA